jgi:hypothetical protein
LKRFVARALVVATAASISSLRAADRSREDDVFEAVFRQQVVELLDPEARARGVVLCLEVDPGGAASQSVSKEFLARFKDEAAVRRAAECEVGPTRAREIASGHPAIVVTAGVIEPVAPDEVWVTVVQRYRRAHSFKRQYRVVRERTRWISLGEIFRGLPTD